MKNSVFTLLALIILSIYSMSCQATSLAGMGQPTLPESTFTWHSASRGATLRLPSKCDLVVKTAAEMLSEDLASVTGTPLVITKKKDATITAVQLDRTSARERKELSALGLPVDSTANLTDGFSILTSNGHIYIVGANGRGTAYGLLELSRMAGVSPWVWWGDVVPEKRDTLTIADGFSKTEGASVEYRGIFINDEDWSLREWSYRNYEPAEYGKIEPRTYRKIFELLLRLRANAIWPAMHPGTEAFFVNPENKLTADSCGIAIGTSHCEPMLRNNVGEWDVKERGDFNYKTNRDEVQRYWSERLSEVKASEGGNMFTIGMRGIHDGSMEGYKTADEKFEGLQQVIDDQQELLRRHVGDPEKQMQVFVPYKEVLELYEKGLNVPDNVTLLWCDDNYGYLTRMSDESEQLRKGGAGMYYHLSYWGRPHDYLWLTTTQPGLIYHELRTAYDHNMRKLWIANVHDPKIAALDLSLFLDLAWNIDCTEASGIDEWCRNWLATQFGESVAEKITPAVIEFYRLCGMRKPEFMGWSQTELDKRIYHRGLSPVGNTEFSATEFGGELYRYMETFDRIAKVVEEAASGVRPELKDAYFAAVIYPVAAAAAHAGKILNAQIARHIANGSTTPDADKRNVQLYQAAARSQAAYQKVRRLTQFYNDSVAGGKWGGSLDMCPRDLPVYMAPSLPVMLTDAEISKNIGADTDSHELDADGVIVRNACDYSHTSFRVSPVKMLGHSMNAVPVPAGETLTYDFFVPEKNDGTVKVALIPTHAVGKGDIRFSVSIDGGEPTTFSIKEPFRSEGWKQNVLRGQTVREIPVSLQAGKHTLEIRALDDHIVFDQWMLDPRKNRKFYLIPTH